ncbi:MAG: HutD family protein [Shinella sp.]|nr:HutD family protein [Shinella sp.]
MSARLLRSGDYRRMPWKNGGGETVEIAVHPEASDLAAFGWRVSIATVASDGPFSVFPGIDRTLAVLSGGGMELDIEGMGKYVLTPISEPLSFAADAPTAARLSAGAITDLNVMTRRGAFSHRMQHSTTAETKGISSQSRWLLLVASDPLGVETAEGLIGLQPLDTLLVEGPAPLGLVAAAGAAAFHLIEIDPA